MINKSDIFDLDWSHSLRSPANTSKSFKVFKSSLIETKVEKNVSLAISNRIIEFSDGYEKFRQRFLQTIPNSKLKLEVRLKKTEI